MSTSDDRLITGTVKHGQRRQGFTMAAISNDLVIMTIIAAAAPRRNSWPKLDLASIPI